MRIILISFLLSFVLLTYGQPETVRVLQAIIEIDKDLCEPNIIVSEKLDDYTDSAMIQYISKDHGKLKNEDIKYIQFGNIATRLLSENALIELDKIAQKLNSVASSDDENFPLTSFQLINNIFDRDFCVFTKPLFSENKRIAVVKFSVITGNSLGLGDFSSTYLMEKEQEAWVLKEVLESEI